MYCRLVKIKKSIRDTDDDLSDVLLGLQVRVSINDFLKSEYLVDDGYRLLGVGFDCTVHGFESTMWKINYFSCEEIKAENSLSNGTDVNSPHEKRLTQGGDNNVTKRSIALNYSVRNH